MSPRPAATRLTSEDHDLLVRLLRLPTAGPLETGPSGPAPQLWAAGRAYAEAAERIGLRAVQHSAADPAVLDLVGVPAVVRRAAADPGFLACQPNLVLRLGTDRPPARTVMFNVHLDTVAGLELEGPEAPRFDGSRFTGRGAIDAKGPAVALLAGVRGALAADPDLAAHITVLIQAVSGEEGGALGTFGTRALVAQGWYGRLNVFCEPTGLRYLPRATASMTARLRVEGEDAVDDFPERGHNATVLLGFLAQHLALGLSDLTAHEPRRHGGICVAGLQTGPLHNRVYGTGELLINLSYDTIEAGRRLETAVEETVRSGVREFGRRFARAPEFARTAREAEAVLSLQWDKRALPALTDAATHAATHARVGEPGGNGSGGNGSASAQWIEHLLQDRARVPGHPPEQPAFTCDAIWLAEIPDTATVVLGPGTLDANRAHARGEHADLADLDAFADQVTRILLAFAEKTGSHDSDHPTRTRPHAAASTPQRAEPVHPR